MKLYEVSTKLSELYEKYGDLEVTDSEDNPVVLIFHRYDMMELNSIIISTNPTPTFIDGEISTDTSGNTWQVSNGRWVLKN